MPLSSSHRDLINNAILADRPGAGGVSLSEQDRRTAGECVSRVLVDRDLLLEHITYLRTQYRLPAEQAAEASPEAGRRRLARRLGLGFPRNTPLSETELQELLDGGPEAVAAFGRLAELVLNPVALSDLAEQIDEQMPPAWEGALEENAKALMVRGVKRVPDPPGRINRSFLVPSVLGTQGKAPSRAVPRSGPLLLTPQDGEWLVGTAEMAAGATATVEVERRGGGRLAVAVTGFLAAGGGAVLRIAWTDADGRLRAPELTFEDDRLVAEVTADDQDGPRPGDHLVLLHEAAAARGGPWAVRFVLSL
jgi:hypothetical protein